MKIQIQIHINSRSLTEWWLDYLFHLSDIIPIMYIAFWLFRSSFIQQMNIFNNSNTCCICIHSSSTAAVAGNWITAPDTLSQPL